ncbi:MAG: SPFH domain-containing protein [Polaribacter sp.]|nr:SPFH domain-containing protein [Polaribacter sp.]MDG1994574.1 SPFH domain-containing protein [Polaribacter sp.]
MAIIDVVKYQGNDKEFVWKFPSEDLRLGTQLVVKTSQTAFFVKGGEILDQYDPGTTTLKSGNIPLLNKLINIPFGGDSPFQAEVWFVNLISKLDNKWGTPTPIQLEDPKYNIVVPVRAFGQFGMSIENPRKFLETLVGNMPNFSTEKVVEYFKGKIISTITSAIGKKMVLEGVSVLQIHVLLEDLSEFCKEKIKEEFSNYGVKIENFYFVSINIPESDPSVIKLKEAKDLAAKIKIAGKDVYQMDRSYDVLDKAAQNEGTMGSVMGAGMGLGLGFGMGNQMGNMTNSMNLGENQQNQNSSPPPPPPSFTPYFVLINNQQNGPHSLDSIKLLISQGQLSKESLVWKEGMADWSKIMEQNDLKILFGASPPPPPPPINK